jgi:hypothetical protein
MMNELVDAVVKAASDVLDLMFGIGARETRAVGGGGGR